MGLYPHQSLASSLSGLVTTTCAGGDCCSSKIPKIQSHNGRNQAITSLSFQIQHRYRPNSKSPHLHSAPHALPVNEWTLDPDTNELSRDELI